MAVPPTADRDNWHSNDRQSWRNWRDEYDMRYQQELRQQAYRDGVPHWNDGRWCPACNVFGDEWDESCRMCGLPWPDSDRE